MKSWMNEQEENKPVATYVIKADPTKQSGVPQAFDKFNKHFLSTWEPWRIAKD